MRQRTIFVLALVLLGSKPAAPAQELQLKGVILADDPAHSVALVRGASAARARPLRVGDTYSGFVLQFVTRVGARFRNAKGEVLWLTLLEPARPRGREPGSRSTTKRPNGDDWIRRAYSRQADGPRLTREIPVILSDTEVTPRVEAGEIKGLEVLRIPDGTLLAESGLRAGDVVKSVNGHPVSGLDSLVDLLARFSGEPELRVVVERRGELLKLAYALEN